MRVKPGRCHEPLDMFRKLPSDEQKKNRTEVTSSSLFKNKNKGVRSYFNKMINDFACSLLSQIKHGPV